MKSLNLKNFELNSLTNDNLLRIDDVIPLANNNILKCHGTTASELADTLGGNRLPSSVSRVK